MAVGHSDDVDSADAIHAAIAQCRDQLNGETARAGLLFAAFETFDPLIPAAVLEAFPGIELCGSTSYAEMSSIGGFTEDGLPVGLQIVGRRHADRTVLAAAAAFEAACPWRERHPEL